VDRDGPTRRDAETERSGVHRTQDEERRDETGDDADHHTAERERELFISLWPMQRLHAQTISGILDS
jgi:hypothetical protein